MTYILDLTETNGITVTQKEAGITAACARYNADNETAKDFVPLTEAEYISFVLNSAAESYARQYAA